METSMRAPDLTIGPKDDPQTKRWHLFRWWGIQVALHRWERSDSDRALHDHSAGNVSILITGCYTEVFSHAWETRKAKLRIPLVPYYRKASTPHRVELTFGPLWTLWVRFKPWRDWQFYCSQGAVLWSDYVDKRESGLVGKGCG